MDARRRAVVQAFTAVAESLAPLMVGEGISIPDAERVLRLVFVHAVAKGKGPTHSRLNASRVALLTGVDRHVVASILKRPMEEGLSGETRRHRLNRVLSEWYGDPDYTSVGRPKALDVRAPRNRKSFWTLSQTYAKDVYPGLILNELLKAGAVEKLSDGRVRPRMSSYKAGELSEDGVDEIAQRVRDLTGTLLHNLSHPDLRRGCGTVQTIDVDEKNLDLIRRVLQERSAVTLLALDQLLNSSKWQSSGDSSRRVRVGWTCYSFEGLLEDAGNEGKKKRSGHRRRRPKKQV
jgi:hypothetical protein